jgi:glucose-6-phosphate isomerase
MSYTVLQQLDRPNRFATLEVWDSVAVRFAGGGAIANQLVLAFTGVDIRQAFRQRKAFCR